MPREGGSSPASFERLFGEASNGSPVLTARGFLLWGRRLRLELSEEAVLDVFSAVDKDGDGEAVREDWTALHDAFPEVAACLVRRSSERKKEAKQEAAVAEAEQQLQAVLQAYETAAETAAAAANAVDDALAAAGETEGERAEAAERSREAQQLAEEADAVAAEAAEAAMVSEAAADAARYALQRAEVQAAEADSKLHAVAGERHRVQEERTATLNALAAAEHEVLRLRSAMREADALASAVDTEAGRLESKAEELHRRTARLQDSVAAAASQAAAAAAAAAVKQQTAADARRLLDDASAAAAVPARAAHSAAALMAAAAADSERLSADAASALTVVTQMRARLTLAAAELHSTRSEALHHRQADTDAFAALGRTLGKPLAACLLAETADGRIRTPPPTPPRPSQVLLDKLLSPARRD